MAFKTIIGLEIHVELKTKTKIFCSCINEFGGDSNTHTCPVCLGLPGSIPVLNKAVVEYAIMAGLAFNCDIARETKMDRKNYFYPDLVKGFQISQDNLPICSNGHIELEDGKKVRIERIHIEEDTGKSIHTEGGDSLLDYNRAGVPLIEIVSRPDMNSPEEARLFLEKLKKTLEYIGVSDCKMEEGSLRCDVNINIVDEERSLKSNISEIKNLNSFSAAVRAMEYEEKRHRELLEKGENTVKDTRRWDELALETIQMREKAHETDYRYGVEADILPIKISETWIDEIREELPELPEEKMERFMDQYKLPAYDADVLTQDQELADYFEELGKNYHDYKTLSNWVMGDVLRRVKEEEIHFSDLKFSTEDLVELIKLVEEDKISNNVGKKVLRDMFETGEKPGTIVKEKGLIQVSDQGQLLEMVNTILDKNQQSIEDYKNGKDRALGFLVGQVMKESRGKANPQMVNKILKEELDKR